MYMHNNHCHGVTAHLQSNVYYYYCKFLSAGQYKNNLICTVLGYYVAYSGSFLTDVSGQPVGTICKGKKFLTLKEYS